MKKKLPIGISDFKKLIKDDYYYVDKSLFIKELLESGAAATLIPRPRRFGKTLNLSMLRYFFEKTKDSNKHLFKDLKISKEKDCMIHQGQHSVIFLTFKDVKEKNWESCYRKIKKLLSKEFERHYYLVEDDTLTSREKKSFEAIVEGRAEQFIYENSLKDLSEYLAKYHKKKPIILIDEYDSPIHTGFFNEYYDDIIGFMRGFLCGGLKDNSNLEFGVMTGILHVVTGDVLGGINNLKVSSFLGIDYSDKFGLTENEVEQALKCYELSNLIDDVRLWYNGYTAGEGVRVYNPWSIVDFLENDGTLQPYWINTSDNKLIKELIKNGTADIKQDIEYLINGQEIEKQINENIVFDQLESRDDTIWSFLLLSGYLTFQKRYLKRFSLCCSLKIPNREILSFYKVMILNWIKDSYNFDNYTLMLKSLVSGDIDDFRRIFSDFIKSSFSYFDVSSKEPERVYHAFVLGMLVSLDEKYEIKSNRESGYGRYDVMIIPKDRSKLGIIIEFKKVYSDEGETLEQAAQNALQQIEEKQYCQELHSRGIKDILNVGIAFEGKKVLVKENRSYGEKTKGCE